MAVPSQSSGSSGGGSVPSVPTPTVAPTASPTPTVTPTPSVPTPQVSNCMTYTQVSNTGTVGGTRTQIFELSGTPCVGQTVNWGVYSCNLSYTIISGDTLDSVGAELATMTNNYVGWTDCSSGYSTWTTGNPPGFPPGASYNSSTNRLSITLNYQNQFAFSISSAPSPTPTPTVAPTASPTPTVAPTASPSPTVPAPTPTTGSPTPSVPTPSVNTGLTICLNTIQQDVGPDLSFYSSATDAQNYTNAFYTLTNVQQYTSSINQGNNYCFNVTSGYPTSGTIYAVSTNNGGAASCTIVNTYVLAAAPTPTPTVPTPTVTPTPSPTASPTPTPTITTYTAQLGPQGNTRSDACTGSTNTGTVEYTSLASGTSVNLAGGHSQGVNGNTGYFKILSSNEPGFAYTGYTLGVDDDDESLGVQACSTPTPAPTGSPTPTPVAPTPTPAPTGSPTPTTSPGGGGSGS